MHLAYKQNIFFSFFFDPHLERTTQTQVTIAKPIWMNIGGILVLDRTFIFLRKTFMMLMNLHVVSVIIVDVPIQNVKIVLTCTGIMAQGMAQDT